MKYITHGDTVEKIPENETEYIKLQKEYPHLTNFRSVVQAYIKCFICGSYKMPEFQNRCGCR
jgi:hypothetical protein